jgi:hypothetical protein
MYNRLNISKQPFYNLWNTSTICMSYDFKNLLKYLIKSNAFLSLQASFYYNT